MLAMASVLSTANAPRLAVGYDRYFGVLSGRRWRVCAAMGKGRVMSSDVVLDDDAAIIASDFSHATLQRRDTFFRILFAAEYFGGNGDFSEALNRKQKNGLPALFQQLMVFSTKVEDAVKAANNGTPFEFKQGNLAIAWTKFDAWMFSALRFKHELPGLPVVIGQPPANGGSTIPAGYFDAEQSKLDEVLADAQAVKSILQAKVGTSL